MPTDPMQKQLVAAAENAGAITNPTLAGKDLAVIKEAATGANDQVARTVKISTATAQPANDNNQYILYLGARLPLSMDVNDTPSVFGHVFLGGKTPDDNKIAYGFYPSKDEDVIDTLLHNKEPSKQKGRVENDIVSFDSAINKHNGFTMLPFLVTKEQFVRSLDHIKNYANNNDYALFSNNCVDAAFNALSAGGVAVPFERGIRPSNIYNKILSINPRQWSIRDSENWWL